MKEDHKKGMRRLRLAVCGLAAFGWLGWIYPELTLNRDTVRIVSEDGGEEISPDELGAEELFCRLLQASGQQVRCRSRAWDMLHGR